MKFLATGDWHIHNYPQFSKPWKEGLNSRVRDILHGLEEIPRIMQQEKVELFAYLGDWNVNASNDYRLINVTREAVKPCIELVTPPYAIGINGNHDTVSAEPGNHNNYPYLERSNWNFMSYGGVMFYSFGYTCPKLPDPAKLNKKVRMSVFLIHKDIVSGRASNGFMYKDDGAIPVSYFNLIKKELGGRCMFLAGHYHSPQTIGPVTVVGAPVQHNRGDEADMRSVVVCNTDTGKIKRISLDSGPHFCEMSWNDVLKGKYRNFNWADESNYVTIVADDAQAFRDVMDWKKKNPGNIAVAGKKKEEKKQREPEKEVSMLTEKELLKQYLIEKEGIKKPAEVKELLKLAEELL